MPEAVESSQAALDSVLNRLQLVRFQWDEKRSDAVAAILSWSDEARQEKAIIDFSLLMFLESRFANIEKLN